MVHNDDIDYTDERVVLLDFALSRACVQNKGWHVAYLFRSLTCKSFDMEGKYGQRAKTIL